MVQREVFTFESIPHRRLESLMADPFFKEAYRRWGLHSRTNICAFRFEKDTSGAGGGSAVGSVVSGHVRFSGFHKGLLQEFLMSLFEAPAVRQELQLRDAPRGVSAGEKGVQYCELQCRWTTLEPFKRLVGAGVVRCVEEEEPGTVKGEDKETTAVGEFETPLFDGVRMPTVKRADVYLPHDIAVCDELRALFLLAHNESVVGGGDDDDEDCDYMGGGAFDLGPGSGLPLAALRSVFGDAAERSEFLYHILWRLVAGGGTTNQWDDELTMYLEAARAMYKSLVSVRAVAADVLSNANETSGIDEPDRAADAKSTPQHLLKPDIVSTVVLVQAVEGLQLFERNDEASPSNMNYCYVCIDPLLAEATKGYQPRLFACVKNSCSCAVMAVRDHATVVTLRDVTGRVVIVGDIHGCREQLEDLLRLVSFRPGTDTLVATGDFINKGPDSFGVVRLLKRLGAYSVLGNHEVKLLKLLEKTRIEGRLSEEDLKSSLAPLAQSIPADVEEYVSSLPHIIRLPAHNVIVVHAGLHPQREVDRQYPAEVTAVRSFVRAKEAAADGVTLIATDKEGGDKPWASLWRGPETVVFGHDSERDLQEQYKPLAMGLDSGCVYGRRLSAVVFPGWHIVSVPGWNGKSKI